MSAGRPTGKTLSFERSITPDIRMTAEELRAAEQTLARLVAAAYAADHPDEFADKRPDVPIMGSRPEKPAPALSGRANQGNMTAGGIHATLE
jgi:hypothetical protein